MAYLHFFLPYFLICTLFFTVFSNIIANENNYLSNNATNVAATSIQNNQDAVNEEGNFEDNYGNHNILTLPRKYKHFSNTTDFTNNLNYSSDDSSNGSNSSYMDNSDSGNGNLTSSSLNISTTENVKTQKLDHVSKITTTEKFTTISENFITTSKKFITTTLSTIEEIPTNVNFLLPKVIVDKQLTNESSIFVGETGRRIKISEIVNPACFSNSICEPLNNSSCFGIKLPYSLTSFSLTDARTQYEVQDRLKQWEGLKNVPKCWAVVQPLLCALYLPKCENNLVSLPSQRLCQITQGPCKIVADTYGWPEFLRCNNTRTFKDDCRDYLREVTFNTTSKCGFSLVETTREISYYEGIEGCALRCRSPIYSDEQYESFHHFFGVAGGICMACSIFSLLTFFADWQASNKYPALIIFYMNFCFLIASIGWMAQFSPNAREDIVCKKDGTLRQAEPGTGENLSCVIVFILIYYSLMACEVWLVILAYAWYIRFESLGKVKERLEKKAAYFHLIAWSLPLILTITVLSMNAVDGDSISGICFVGYKNFVMRATFLLAPTAVMIVISSYFVSRCVLMLIKIKIGADEILSGKAGRKIRETIFRIGIFMALIVVFVGTTFIFHVYEYRNKQLWEKSVRDYVVCKSKVLIEDQVSRCNFKHSPNPLMFQIQLLCLFGSGIVVSSWVWTKETLNIWKSMLNRIFNQSDNKPVRMKKHELIAQAFAKREELRNLGKLSLSFQSAHDDPVGMNIELNSGTSGDFSSTWAAAIPHLMSRRGAIFGPDALGLCRSSVDSEVSLSIHSNRFSWLDSRRQSLDSQASLQMHDLERLRAIHAATLRASKKSKRMLFKKRRPFGSRNGSRRASNTSLSTGSQILPAITLHAKHNSDVTNKHLGLHKSNFKSKLDTPIVPLPGQSTDFGAANPIFTISGLPFDHLGNISPGYFELEEKLRELASISRLSHLSDSEEGIFNKNHLPTNKYCTKSNKLARETGVQTLQDVACQTSHSLENISVTLVSKSIQVSPTISTINLDEDAPLKHIEANVIKIGNCSGEESSIPSSYEMKVDNEKKYMITKSKGKENNLKKYKDSYKTKLNQLDGKKLNKSRSSYPHEKRLEVQRRGRRGAISETNLSATINLSGKVNLGMEEIELLEKEKLQAQTSSTS